MRVLVTGGAGFIGSHVVDNLLARGYEVRVLDSLEPQVHGPRAGRPSYLNEAAELLIGDCRDRRAVDGALDGAELLVHLAALVGVGQSMYQVEHYVDLNTRGTAQVLDALVSRRHAVRKMVVASSMSIYGEGAYRCRRCGPASASLRGADQLERRDWEVRCPACAEPLEHQPTSESKPLQPTSVYAQTKRHQEELCLLAGRTYGLPVVALRYFNTYGPRQALSNPYTGIGAIFAARLLNDQPPVIFEDGRQSRDFIHVRDVAEATCLALERDDADGLALNVGTGVRTSVHEVARLLSLELKGREMMEVTGRFRQGDIRHCYADCSLITRRLGFAPAVPLAEGLAELARGVADARAADAFPASLVELERRGLVG